MSEPRRRRPAGKQASPPPNLTDDDIYGEKPPLSQHLIPVLAFLAGLCLNLVPAIVVNLDMATGFGHFASVAVSNVVLVAFTVPQWLGVVLAFSMGAHLPRLAVFVELGGVESLYPGAPSPLIPV